MKLRRAVRLSTLGLLVACAPQRPADVVVYASGTDLESANPLVTVHPLSRQIQRYALFVTLAKYDDRLEPAPYAARRWEWSADKRTLILHLVADLRWHDGRPTTAHDVAFTLDAARDPATGYYRTADLAGIQRVEIRDDTTAAIEFTSPQTTFPPVLCELPIVPEHLLGRVAHSDMRRAAFDLDPVGNGPYRFVDRRAGARWTFRRNEDFPADLGGPPKTAGLVVAVVDEPTTKFAGLASGDLDVAGIAPTMANLARSDKAMRVIDYPVAFVTGLVFNTTKGPFDDARVRQAISLSIDRGRIVNAALAGYGTAASGPVPPDSPYALDTTVAHDTTRADSLLDAAGWARSSNGRRHHAGRDFTFDLLTVGSGDNALEQLVQADLAARGIQVNIRQVELGTFLTEARATPKRFDAMIAGVPGDISLAYLASMFESRQRGGSLDYSGYHASVLDSLFAATRSAPDDARRAAAWRTVQRDLDVAVPVAWLYHSRGVQGISARLRNVTMDLRGEMVTLSQWEVGVLASRVARR